MSQEAYAPGGPKNPRRDSILKARQNEEEITRNTRRVSFHNVRVVQYYDKDIKNCPELLHGGTPVKEKINETLGSDGVFTPGRTTISENSNHSSKNNTIDMFGEGAKKPIAIVPAEEHEKFEIKETPPSSLEMTNFNSIDMSVCTDQYASAKENTFTAALGTLESTDYETIDMSISNESTKIDDTLQMFSKSGVHSGDSDTTLSETMQMFANTTTLNTTRKAHNSSILNKTADMFANIESTKLDSSSAVDETIDMFNVEPTTAAANNSTLNNTMDAFKSPMKVSRSSRPSLSATMNMFNTPEKPATPYKKRVSMSTTMAMFESPGRNQTQHNESHTEASNTLLMFEEPEAIPEAEEPKERDLETAENQSVVMTDVTQKLDSSVIPVTKSVETVVISSDKTGDYSVMAERFRGTSPARTAMSILHNETVLLTERTINADSSVNLHQVSMVMDDTLEVSKPHRTLSRTLDALMDDTRNLSMHRASILEENRGMCVDVDYSGMVEHVEPRLRDKSAVLESGDDVSQMISMDVSQTLMLNTSARTNTSRLNQSSRSRRRSSLSNTIRDLIQQSPVPPVDLNTSVDLSFSNSSNLFDDMLTRITYLENGVECNEQLRNKMLHKLISESRSSQERKIKQLGDITPNLEEKFPEKAKAVKTLNSRKLGAVDRDLMMAARCLAEKDLLERRVAIAQEYGSQTKEMRSTVASYINEAESKADLCGQVEGLKNDVTRLNERWKIVTENEIGTLKNVFSRHSQLIKALEKEEEDNAQLEIKALMEEKAFIERKYKEQKEIGKVLENAKKEKECNKQLLLEKLRNVDFETAAEVTESSTLDDNGDYQDTSLMEVDTSA